MTMQREVQIHNMAASLMHRCGIDPAGRELTCRLSEEPVASNAGAMTDWTSRQLAFVPTHEIPRHYARLFQELGNELVGEPA